ncbi:hypothetical protein CKO31_13185 [Thiohalocapsa halophila]|uniref:Helicase C-terminal domain-containing protein n=2 Tax=Thiohalocapsa halophila TaxID=69359 RepID=A0ABS1CID9_9GAMM|nr:hypothetical protein [Thiohalocapsa halophila]
MLRCRRCCSRRRCCRSGGRLERVMVLSPKAAGVGLTLTAANHVIHLSRWWNPAVEDQCTDRVYRIGQQRDVHVHIPLAMHPTHEERSFDANLHRLLEDKRRLSVSVLAAPTATSSESLPGHLQPVFQLGQVRAGSGAAGQHRHH